LRDTPASYNWFVGAKAPKSIDAGVIEKEEVFRIPAVQSVRFDLPPLRENESASCCPIWTGVR
jgi:hypothetical protein